MTDFQARRAARDSRQRAPVSAPSSRALPRQRMIPRIAVSGGIFHIEDSAIGLWRLQAPRENRGKRLATDHENRAASRFLREGKRPPKRKRRPQSTRWPRRPKNGGETDRRHFTANAPMRVPGQTSRARRPISRRRVTQTAVCRSRRRRRVCSRVIRRRDAPRGMVLAIDRRLRCGLRGGKPYAAPPLPVIQATGGAAMPYFFSLVYCVPA